MWLDDCHDSIEVFHSELAKDDADHPQHQQARALAVRQVEHEWCRLLNVLGAEYGTEQDAALPLTLWTGPQATPHPAGTPCAAAAAGTGAGDGDTHVDARHRVDRRVRGRAELRVRLVHQATCSALPTPPKSGPFDYGDDELVARRPPAAFNHPVRQFPMSRWR